MARAAGWLLDWNEIDCPFCRGLTSEEDLQDFIKTIMGSLKDTSVLTPGLEAFLTALSDRHETNQYLLGQVMAERGIKAAVRKTAKQIKVLWIVTNPNDRSTLGDMVAEVDALSLGQIAIGTGASRWKHEDTALHDDARSAVSDAMDRLKKFYKGDIPTHVLMDVGGERGAKSWKPPRVAAEDVAPTAEGLFILPESSEVREFAESGSNTNVPEVAEDSAREMDEPVAEAVEQAEDGPPTPDEIEELPGSEEVSTLNRFLIDEPVKVEGERMAAEIELRRRYFTASRMTEKRFQLVIDDATRGWNSRWVGRVEKKGRELFSILEYEGLRDNDDWEWDNLPANEKKSYNQSYKKIRSEFLKRLKKALRDLGDVGSTLVPELPWKSADDSAAKSGYSNSFFVQFRQK